MPSHLTKRHQTYFVRLNIPRDVQPAFSGRKIFIASTHKSDLKWANAVAAPMIAAWQHRIDEARLSKPDPARDEIDRLTREYRRLNGAADDASAILIYDVTRFVFEKLGGMTADERRQTWIAKRGNGTEALRSLPVTAQTTFAAITGTTTRFLHHFDAWHAATHLNGKTRDQAFSQIKRFAVAVPDAKLETLSGAQVQKWIEGLLRPKTGDAVHPKTINSYLASIRSYWEWLQSHDYVPETVRPFWNRKVLGSKTEGEQADDQRDRWEPDELVRLWRAADEKNDLPLANAIRIAAYTGARREGICSLKVSSIGCDPATNVRFMHFAEKTRAGRRDVPIHSAIAGLIDGLLKRADEEGYLIPCEENKYGKRGDGLGKRFTRLKQELGFDNLHVFHSIRHTVSHLLESAECPEGVAQDVVGHVKRGMTYGLYSGVTKLDLRSKWIEQAIRYPD